MGCCLLKGDDTNATKVSGNGISQNLIEASRAADFMGSNAMNSFVELSISCSHLLGQGIIHTIDPFCVVYIEINGTWKEMGRTEIIANTVNPKFVKKIGISYNFEEVQKIRFDIYTADSGFKTSDVASLDLADQIYIGKTETILAKIFGSHGYVWSGNLDTNSQSTVNVIGEELQNTNAQITMNIHCENVDNTDFFTLSDVFIKFSKVREDNTYVPCFRTEVKKNNLNPVFAEIVGGALLFANGDFHRTIKLEVLDYEPTGRHQLIGEAETSLHLLHELSKQRTANGKPIGLPIINPDKKAKLKKKYKNSGLIFVDSFIIKERPSFLDYIRGGTELSFMVGIDFTASNGDPHMRDSLHYVDPSGHTKNHYVNAIVGVGQVIEFYDHDKRFPVYGFGGKQPGGQVNHCFALTGNDNVPEVVGVHGILNAYYSSLNHIHLSGPTIFSPLIRQAVRIAGSSEQTFLHQKYFILLLLTDGMINDLDNTIDAIIEASGFPLSILIVGIGNADFSTMEQLDSDNQKLTSRYGKEARRDIVQFTAMRDFEGKTGLDFQNHLVKSLLEEIPGQLVDYYEALGIKPKIPAAAAAPPSPSNADAESSTSSQPRFPFTSTPSVSQQHPLYPIDEDDAAEPDTLPPPPTTKNQANAVQTFPLPPHPPPPLQS